MPCSPKGAPFLVSCTFASGWRLPGTLSTARCFSPVAHKPTPDANGPEDSRVQACHAFPVLYRLIHFTAFSDIALQLARKLWKPGQGHPCVHITGRFSPSVGGLEAELWQPFGSKPGPRRILEARSRQAPSWSRPADDRGIPLMPGGRSRQLAPMPDPRRLNGLDFMAC